MRAALGLGLALALAWPAAAEVTVGSFTPAMTKDAQGAAKRARGLFDKEMLDFPSARFRDVRAIAGPKGGTRFCGFVNGKNRMGAYSGWKEFHYSELREPSIDIRDDDDILVDVFCHRSNGTQDARDWSQDLSFR